MVHTQLPIYRAADEFFGLSMDMAKQMPRDLKRLIGEKIRDECLGIMLCIQSANTAQDKAPHLVELVERSNTAGALLRFSVNRRLIPRSKYAVAVQLLDSIGKQATGWRKASLATSPAAPRSRP